MILIHLGWMDWSWISLIPILGYLDFRSSKEEEMRERAAALARARKEREIERKAKKEMVKLTKLYPNSTPAFIIPCKACRSTAITISFDFSKQKITVATLVNYTLKSSKPEARECSALVSEKDFVEAFSLAKGGKFRDLNRCLHGIAEIKDGFKRWLFEDGLINFCNKCDGAYCWRHHDTYPVIEEGGWYDYTIWVCPLKHEHIIDD